MPETPIDEERVAKGAVYRPRVSVSAFQRSTGHIALSFDVEDARPVASLLRKLADEVEAFAR